MPKLTVGASGDQRPDVADLRERSAEAEAVRAALPVQVAVDVPDRVVARALAARSRREPGHLRRLTAELRNAELKAGLVLEERRLHVGGEVVRRPLPAADQLVDERRRERRSQRDRADRPVRQVVVERREAGVGRVAGVLDVRKAVDLLPVVGAAQPVPRIQVEVQARRRQVFHALARALVDVGLAIELVGLDADRAGRQRRRARVVDQPLNRPDRTSPCCRLRAATSITFTVRGWPPTMYV